jgi:hypothetical protein
MVDFTWENGPIRQIPGTQNTREPPPGVADEPAWMKLSTVLCPAGSAIFRDLRAWHGGTPNLSAEARAIPNVEYCAPWWNWGWSRTMPAEMYDALPPHGKVSAPPAAPSCQCRRALASSRRLTARGAQHVCRNIHLPAGELPPQLQAHEFEGKRVPGKL